MDESSRDDITINASCSNHIDTSLYCLSSNPTTVLACDLGDGKVFDKLVLDTDEYAATTAFTYNEKGYIGMDTIPAKVVRFDIKDMRREEALCFSDDESHIVSSFHTSDGFGYFSTYTSPIRLLKVNLKTMEHVSSLTFNKDENFVTTSFTDGKGYGYFATSIMFDKSMVTTTSPPQTAKLVKINLKTMTHMGSIGISLPIIKDTTITTTSMPKYKYANHIYSMQSGFTDYKGYGYFGALVGYSYDTKFTDNHYLLKIKLDDMSIISYIRMEKCEGCVTSSFMDGEYGYFCTSNSIIKILLSDFIKSEKLKLHCDEKHVHSAVVDLYAKNCYVAYGNKTDVLKVSYA